jgi:sec-independent protein translocase protein TatB
VFGIGGGEALVLLILGLLILGPERLPKVAADATRTLRDLRRMAERARADVTRELGPEFEDIGLADLNPRRFVSRHLLDDELDDEPRPARARRTRPTAGPGPGSRPSVPGPTATPAADTHTGAPAELPPYDADAT